MSAESRRNVHKKINELRRCNTVGDERGVLYFARAISSEKGVKNNL